jgi:lipid-binding SYLF domain-containing protein
MLANLDARTHNPRNSGRKNMKRFFVIALCIAACSPTPDSAEEAQEQHSDVVATINDFQQTDTTIGKFFQDSYGYAVFPGVAKGGAGIGAANGTGEVFEQGVHVGYAELTQVTVGIQLGGQGFDEVVFFKDKQTLDEFKNGQFTLAAQVSAVAVKAGAAEKADYQHGVAVFTQPNGGAMYEVSVGGQEFDYANK